MQTAAPGRTTINTKTYSREKVTNKSSSRLDAPDALDAGHFVIPIFELNRSTLPNAFDAGHFVVPILELLVVGLHCVFPPETVLFYIRASGRIKVLTPTTYVSRAGPRMLVLFEQ